MADGELEVKLVPDDQAIEEMEKKQLEISGEADSVDEATELNEEQNSKLRIANRKLGRIATRTGLLAAIAGTLAFVGKALSSILDIRFSDVRDAIVTAIDTLVDELKSLFAGPAQTLSSATGLSQGQSESLFALGTPFGPSALGSLSALGFSSLGSAIGSGAASNQQSSASQDVNVSMFTSRDKILGDSTQQEMQSQVTQDFILNGGS